MRLFGLLVAGILRRFLVRGCRRTDTRSSSRSWIVSISSRFPTRPARVSNLRLESGHLVCTLASGSIAYVKAGDEVVGIFFQGNGTMEYVTEDPIEAPRRRLHGEEGHEPLPGEDGQGSSRSGIASRRLLWIATGEKTPDIRRVRAARIGRRLPGASREVSEEARNATADVLRRDSCSTIRRPPGSGSRCPAEPKTSSTSAAEA